MKKVTLAVVLLVSLSFTAVQTNNSEDASVMNDSLKGIIKSDSLQDSLVQNESKNIEEVEEDLSKKANVSWYGNKFHGRLTSSGERYDMNELTAAHKTLPFGTKVKIKNPRNGKEVVVRITDRGPFVPKREFDLSKAAFEELGALDSGVLKVTYVIL